jgi:hypothetical protein
MSTTTAQSETKTLDASSATIGAAAASASCDSKMATKETPCEEKKETKT